ncbi:MAG: hypothetical protein IIT46_10565, partial [Lachnospiraceae bacterium]|nr:hypothetical protein [Lachnospiraceae bacterium]
RQTNKLKIQKSPKAQRRAFFKEYLENNIAIQKSLVVPLQCITMPLSSKISIPHSNKSSRKTLVYAFYGYL